MAAAGARHDAAWRRRPALRHGAALGLLYAALVLSHWPLLQLPYFWDEAGYFIPAARDLLLRGEVIPSSTPSNAHPPLVMAYLATWWKLAGFTPLVTRVAMLGWAALALLGIYRLATLVAARPVAIATVALTALYPVFFAQSTLVHLDLPAAALTLWGLSFYLRAQRTATAAAFTLAALTKATAVVTPLALLAWEVFCAWRRRTRPDHPLCRPFSAPQATAPATAGVHRGVSWSLLLPVLPLSAWFAWHALQTGYAFGNPQFFAYNVAGTLDPVRVLLAGGIRLWHLFGYMNMLLLTLAAAVAMFFPPVRDSGQERPRIAIAVQAVFAVVIAGHVAMYSLIGGALLARYLLPVMPLVILLAVSTLRRRLRHWPVAAAAIAGGFLLALLTTPPYRFAPEDNLAYRDAVLLYRQGAELVVQHRGAAPVLTAWPMTDALTRPYLGYVRAPLPVMPVENFSAAALLPHARAAAQGEPGFGLVVAFSLKYEPHWTLLDQFPALQRAHVRLLGHARDLPPEAVASMLGGRVIFRQERRGLWLAVIQVERTELATLGSDRGPPPAR